MSSPGAVTRLANAAASQMGSIDVWINNAGYSGRYQVLSFLWKIKDMQSMVDVVVYVVLLLS